MYNNYYNYVKSIIDNNDLSSFKSNKYYNAILEHVSKDLGYEYIKLLRNEFNLSDADIIDFCNLNDKIGTPHLCNVFELNVSPSSLRYIYHSHLILSYMKALNLNRINRHCKIIRIF